MDETINALCAGHRFFVIFALLQNTCFVRIRTHSRSQMEKTMIYKNILQIEKGGKIRL